MIPRWMVPAAVLAAAAAPVAAQAPAQRVDLERFRDSIAQVTDSAPLVALEARLIEIARIDRDNAVLHLRLGFLALRIGDLGSAGRFEDAGSEFEWAVELQPGWPWAWFGLGLAEAGLADPGYGWRTQLRAMLGVEPLARATRAFLRALEQDPGFAPALVALVDVHLRRRLDGNPAEVLRVVRGAAGGDVGRLPAFQLARGRLERSAGDLDSAAAAFRRYLALGGDPALGRLELTRVLLAAGRGEGDSLYYAVAALEDTLIVAALRADLALIAGDSGVRAFDAEGGAGRPAFLRRFWTGRDRADLRRDGERLAEHYRRLIYAERHFRRVPSRRRITGFQDYRQEQLEFDARGEMYIRHGAPTERVVAPAFCSESWRYARADGDRFYHFATDNRAEGDYSLVASVLEVCGPETLALSPVQGWAPEYGRLVAPGRVSADRFRMEQRWKGEDAIAEGVRSDRFELAFARTIRAVAELHAVGRGPGGSLVHVSFAIPGAGLRPVPIGGGYEYEVEVRLAGWNRSGAEVAVLDTLRVFRTAEPVADDQFLAARVALAVPPRRMRYRLSLLLPDSAGGTFPRDSLVVGRFDGAEPAVSDLVLGHRGADLVWVPAPGDTVFFNPLGTFRATSAMELYYEVYGLAPGSAYQTRLAVRRGRQERPQITLGFTEEAGRGVTRVRRTLDLNRLRPGDYWLEITVTGADGRTAEQRRAFRVGR